MEMGISERGNIWGAYGPTARAVALEVLLHGPIARTELAERIGLSPGSLSRLTKPLLEDGVLRESESQPRLMTGGRPRQPLEVNADFETFVGIKLTGRFVHSVVTNLRAEVLHFASEELRSTLLEDVILQIVDLIRGLKGFSSIHAVGICLGAAVDDYRCVRHAPFLGWEDIDLAGQLEARVGIPFHISNDLEALTRLERWFGSCRSLKNFAIITTGAGVGLGVVVNQEFLSTRDAGLGLIGHQPLNWLGPSCSEGHRGCASAYLDMAHIEERSCAALARSATYEQIVDLSVAGDPTCAAIADETGRAMGSLVSMVCNICLPERVLITGEGWRLMAAQASNISRTVVAARPALASGVDIEVRPDDPSVWAAGAAALAIERSIMIG